MGTDMTYRVVNLSTGEIRAELHDFIAARDHANQLAVEINFKEIFGVIRLVTVYETPRRAPTNQSHL